MFCRRALLPFGSHGNKKTASVTGCEARRLRPCLHGTALILQQTLQGERAKGEGFKTGGFLPPAWLSQLRPSRGCEQEAPSKQNRGGTGKTYLEVRLATPDVQRIAAEPAKGYPHRVCEGSKGMRWSPRPESAPSCIPFGPLVILLQGYLAHKKMPPP